MEVASWIVNLSKLKKEINEYVHKNGRLPYLFMNRDTIDMFWEDIKGEKEKYPEEHMITDINPSYISGGLGEYDLMWHYGYCDNYNEDDVPEDIEKEIEKLKYRYYGTTGRYNGCKVYLNEDLDYGQVEIK